MQRACRRANSYVHMTPSAAPAIAASFQVHADERAITQTPGLQGCRPLQHDPQGAEFDSAACDAAEGAGQAPGGPRRRCLAHGDLHTRPARHGPHPWRPTQVQPAEQSAVSRCAPLWRALGGVVADPCTRASMISPVSPIIESVTDPSLRSVGLSRTCMLLGGAGAVPLRPHASPSSGVPKMRLASRDHARRTPLKVPVVGSPLGSRPRPLACKHALSASRSGSSTATPDTSLQRSAASPGQ